MPRLLPTWARPTSAIRGLATAAVWLLASCSTAAKSPDPTDIASADTASADTAADTSPADTSPADTSTDSSPTAFDPCGVDVELAYPPTPADRTTPRWAFGPWISKDISTADDTREFVKGFKDRGIPVGVVVIDSPWETNYHTFIANPKRYPGFFGLVDELHAQQVRVVIGMTSQVNDQDYDVESGGDTYDGPSPNFAEGLACGRLCQRRLHGAVVEGLWRRPGLLFAGRAHLVEPPASSSSAKSTATSSTLARCTCLPCPCRPPRACRVWTPMARPITEKCCALAARATPSS